MKIGKFWAAACLLALAAVPAFGIEPSSSCQALETWASELTQLPTDYAAFSALPLGHRKAVYGRLSSAERAALWQHQWQEALQQGSYTREQKALIEDAGSLMTADTFAALKPREGEAYDSARAALDAFENRVEAVFSKAEATALFYRLGTPLSAIPPAGMFLYCYCQVGGDDCDAGKRCELGGCKFRYTGCGIIYEDPCDGQCRYI